MDYNNVFEEAYENYFGKKKDIQILQQIDKQDKVAGIIKDERLQACGNISTVNQLGDLLKRMLNAIWGSNWGDFSPESSGGDDHNNVVTPSIRYSTNLREVSEGRSPKPTLMDVKDIEVVGVATGEHYKIYRQSFDCIVEFNVRAKTSRDCTELAEKFEDTIILNSGYLKKVGVSEIFFLKEVPARYSNYFVENIPAKCLYFFVRLEKVRTVSISSIKEIEAKLNVIGENFDDNGIKMSIQ